MALTHTIRLSICIATFRRAAFIAETLESIVSQLTAECELVIVEGASPDNTAEVVRPFLERYPNVRYCREEINSGVDRDFDKAVSYASGDYCWLMTDDDLMVTGAIDQVLRALEDVPELVVVNSKVCSANLKAELRPSLLSPHGPASYAAEEMEALFVDVGFYLSFIGGVVIRRATWLQRNRAPYFGTLFVHFGVIFQAPLTGHSKVLREPLVMIRYGNAMWLPRSFEIWMFKWPALVWSMSHLSESARLSVSPRQPFLSLRKLVWLRANGGYTSEGHARIRASDTSDGHRLMSWLVFQVPVPLMNACCAIYCWLRKPSAGRMALYELSKSVAATRLTLALARHRRVV